MSFTKLTTKEVESKIDQLIERTNTLTDILQDIKDSSAKAALQMQLDNYFTTLDHLRTELEIRLISSGRSAPTAL
jgi:hypothetical protein